MDYVSAANQLRDLAITAVGAGRAAEAVPLWEPAYTAAMMARSAFPISFKLYPRQVLHRPVAAAEHVIVRLSRRGIAFTADLMLVTHPISEFSRFAMVGECLSNIAAKLPEESFYECILDLGDGNDLGDYPRIAYSSARADAILVPDPYFDTQNNYAVIRQLASAITWRQREKILFWRGSAAGRVRGKPAEDALFDPVRPTDWAWSQRAVLCAAACKSRYADRMDIGFSSVRQYSARLQKAAKDAGFLKQARRKQHFLAFRYQIDIDGWSNSWSLLEKLIMGATVFKVASPDGYRQWYYDRLEPWIHYVPLAADLSDMDEKFGWALDHPEEAEKIAANAHAFGETMQLHQELAIAEGAITAALTPIR